MTSGRNTTNAGAAPRVTVIVVCYSHERYFDATLESALGQTAPIKLLLVNNGAHESYARKIRSAAAEHGLALMDEPVNLYGVGVRVKALPMLDTEFVATLHDDDIYQPDKIERSLCALDRSGADFLVTSQEMIDEDGRSITTPSGVASLVPYDGTESRGRLLADPLNPPARMMHYSTLVMRSQLAKKNFMGDPFHPRIQDTLFWGDMLLDESIAFQILPERLSKIRIHAASDRNYDKFEPEKRQRQLIQHAFSEVKYLERIFDRGSERVILDFLTALTGQPLSDDLVLALVTIAVLAERHKHQFWIAQQSLIHLCFHKAFALDPVRSCALLERMSGLDANRFMTSSYDRLTEMLYVSCRPGAGSA